MVFFYKKNLNISSNSNYSPNLAKSNEVAMGWNWAQVSKHVGRWEEDWSQRIYKTLNNLEKGDRAFENIIFFFFWVPSESEAAPKRLGQGK